MKVQEDGEDYLRDIMDDLRAEGTPYARGLLVHFGEPVRLPMLPAKWGEYSLNKFVKDMRKYANEQLRIARSESLPADPLADLDVQIVIGQIEQLR
jgi:hypothetical protein